MISSRLLLATALLATVTGCGADGSSTVDPGDASIDLAPTDTTSDRASVDTATDRTSADTASDRNAPDVMAPDVTSPDATVPDVTVPDVTAPDVVSPDVVSPDVTSPDVVSPDVTTPDAGDATVPAGPTALLEVYALDLWAQPLPVGGYTLTMRSGGVDVPAVSGASEWVRSVELGAASTIDLSLSAPDHRTLNATITFDGTAASSALTARATTTGAGLAVTHTVRTVAGRSTPVHTVYLGLRHLWFSAQGRPARRGNSLRLLMDGEEAWTAVNTEFRAARTSAHVATWWWESDFELTRNASTHVTSTEAQRRANTVLSVLEGSPARKRVLVGQFLSMDGSLSTLSTDAALRAHGTTAGDNFEHMGQANPSTGIINWQIPAFRFGDRVRAEVSAAASTTIAADTTVNSEVAPRTINLMDYPTMASIELASYHQKFAVLDGRVAFIGGMNLRRVDWDTSQHLVFDPRRMLIASTTAQRQAVASHDALPDTGPRKDYMVRIEGPIVRDAEDVFHRRWRYLLDTHARYSEDASDYSVPTPAAPVAGGVSAQVTATLPPPFNEYAIAETWFNAVAQARDYIYIEDQYFRIPMLTDAIQRRMDAVPSLRLVVITKPINEWTDPGCAWTYRTHQQFNGRYPGRYMLLQLKAFDTQVTWGFDETDARFVDMDTHAKILIVDDRFLSVGSCNKNNRGIEYEAELNVAVLDDAWVRAARRRIFANILGVTTVSDDTATWWSALSRAAANNDAVRARWTAEGDDISLDGAPLPAMYRPTGFVYNLVLGPPADCLLESIGPDVV